MFTIGEVIAAAKEFVEPGLLELIAIGEQVTTPDGRWEAVQGWLRNHPKWRKKVDQWFELEPRDAYIEIREAIINDSESPRFFEMVIRRVVNADAEARIIKNIENLQTVYRERKGERPKLNARSKSKRKSKPSTGANRKRGA